MVGDSKHCRVGTGLGIKCAGTGGVREITNPVQASTYVVHGLQLVICTNFLVVVGPYKCPSCTQLIDRHTPLLFYAAMHETTLFSLFHQSQTYSAMNTIIFQSILANGRHVLQTYLPERPNILYYLRNQSHNKNLLLS